MKRIAVIAILLSLAGAAAVSAAGVDVLIKMDDLPPQQVNGLLHPKGVLFGFTVGGGPSSDAMYASGGPGSTTFVQDPSIEGTTLGILSVTFPFPTPVIQFGAVRSDATVIPVGAAVQLFDAANVSQGITNLPFNPLVSFTEAQFNYTGVPIKRMTVDFTKSTVGERFVFDNLLFQVPEPSSAVLLMFGISLIPAARCRRRRVTQ